MKKGLTFITIILLSFCGLNAQEIVSGLQFNEAIRHERNNGSENKPLKQSAANQQALQLPFFDDFSSYSLYPDQSKWIGKTVYVNKAFPQYPTNVGAATFDAIDASGAIYENADWIPFEADVMTSQLIRLDSVFEPVTRDLGPQDSIYLSFYYQPQGNGNEPESWDTLILDFAYFGDTVFSHMDSTTWSTQYWLTDIDDTIPPLTILYNPAGMGCNEELYITTYVPLTWNDSVTIPCDSIFGPDTLWQTMWYAEGMSLSDFKSVHGTDFAQVMIPLYTDTSDLKFFTDHFQFRFRNYASIANDIIPSWRSNVDMWNIDWVYLNYNRNAGDSTYRKLVFSQSAPSFLKEYQSMPWRQYFADLNPNLLKPNIEMYIANLDDVEHNTDYEYKVQQVNGEFNFDYYGGSCNLLPFDLFGFQNCNSSCGAAHACPPVNSIFFSDDVLIDTTSFLITHYISDSSETDVIIDSTSFTQGFYNYFAYDDGTPEFGYGVEPAGALVAYQFSMSVPDTLRGVQMYFNKTQDNSNDIFFFLNVWKDNNGEPGELIYSSSSLKPQWEDGLYVFYPYMLDTTLIVSGTFYVGWQQQAGGNMNIGLDSNNDNGDKIFFSTDNDWINSDVSGSLMIRPIVGPDMILDVDENLSQETVQTIRIYPNPTNHSFKVDQSAVDLSNSAVIKIYNLYGSEVFRQQNVESDINISSLSRGMYIVKILDQGKMYSSKLIINR